MGFKNHRLRSCKKAAQLTALLQLAAPQLFHPSLSPSLSHATLNPNLKPKVSNNHKPTLRACLVTTRNSHSHPAILTMRISFQIRKTQKGFMEVTQNNGKKSSIKSRGTENLENPYQKTRFWRVNDFSFSYEQKRVGKFYPLHNLMNKMQANKPICLLLFLGNMFLMNTTHDPFRCRKSRWVFVDKMNGARRLGWGWGWIYRRKKNKKRSRKKEIKWKTDWMNERHSNEN